jgi:hypothetical protein
MKLSDYYKEMRNKYGFDEGQTPEGIEKIRELIIKKVNAKLKRIPKFANVQIIEHDRVGLHNWCLIDFWHKERNDYWEPSVELESEILQILLDLDQEYDIVQKVIIRPIRI